MGRQDTVNCRAGGLDNLPPPTPGDEDWLTPGCDEQAGYWGEEVDGGTIINSPCPAIGDQLWPWPTIVPHPMHASPSEAAPLVKPEPSHATSGADAPAIGDDDDIAMACVDVPTSIHAKPEPSKGAPPLYHMATPSMCCVPPAMLRPTPLSFGTPNIPCRAVGIEPQQRQVMSPPKHACPTKEATTTKPEPYCSTSSGDAGDGDDDVIMIIPETAANTKPESSRGTKPGAMSGHTITPPLPSDIPAMVLTEQQKVEKYGLQKHRAPAELVADIGRFELWCRDRIDLTRPERYRAVQSTTFGKQELHIYAFLGFSIR